MKKYGDVAIGFSPVSCGIFLPLRCVVFENIIEISAVRTSKKSVLPILTVYSLILRKLLGMDVHSIITGERYQTLM